MNIRNGILISGSGMDNESRLGGGEKEIRRQLTTRLKDLRFFRYTVVEHSKMRAKINNNKTTFQSERSRNSTKN